jgi:UDP-N-acetylglucosamine 2-epimerase (non-hydrolysing)
MKIAHIEAGLRSFNFLQPFPEEIDRLLVSNVADIHFCPNEWAINNIRNKRGLKINTKNNTLIDSLKIALDENVHSKFLSDNHNSKFFIFILHRQENLLNKKLVDHLMNNVIEASHNLPCLFILHEPTKKVLSDMNIIEKLKTEKNITLLSRVSYLEFMQILSSAEYIITDGGSNQEECYYLGKPCLILREKTERIEGLNDNVLLGGSNVALIDSFISNYKSYKRKVVPNNESPSLVITNILLNL